MCCPGRAVLSNSFAPDQPRRLLVGETGLIEVIYSGIMAMAPFEGAVTGVKYRFGRERARGYVDKRDLQWFLDYIEYGKKVFSEKLG